MTALLLVLVLTPPALLGLAFISIFIHINRALKNWE